MGRIKGNDAQLCDDGRPGDDLYGSFRQARGSSEPIGACQVGAVQAVECARASIIIIHHIVVVDATFAILKAPAEAEYVTRFYDSKWHPGHGSSVIDAMYCAASGNGGSSRTALLRGKITRTRKNRLKFARITE